MGSTLRRGIDHGVFLDKFFPDLGSAPGWILSLDRQDGPFDLKRQIVAVPVGSSAWLFQAFGA